jgi:hypothetical protein
MERKDNMSYDSVDLINTSTKCEAESAYEEFVHNVRQHNKKNTFWLLTTLVATMFCEFLVYRFLKADVQAITMIVLGVIGGIVIKVLLDEYKSDCKIFQPPAYLYHKFLESSQFLNAKMKSLDDEYVLVLDMADQNGEVSHKFIYGFQKVEKLGINTATADLQTRKFYVPYGNGDK